jgi:large subunit ribosomal protein L28
MAASARLTRAVAAANPLLLPATAFSAASSQSSLRPFSTTVPCQTKTVKPHLLPSNVIPPYPYGERRLYKQSNRGLYGSARIRFGNRVAHKHKQKSPRYWKPNIHVKSFFLPSVGANVKTRLTLRVLKTIRREDGLENYLLKSKPARIKELGPGGWNLRWLLTQSRPVQERFNEERVALGLEPKEIVDRDDIIQYALDFATPGPLSKRSRATVDGLKAAELEAQLGLVGNAFLLGNEAELLETENVEELSDEAEQQLLKEIDELEVASAETLGASKAETEARPSHS